MIFFTQIHKPHRRDTNLGSHALLWSTFVSLAVCLCLFPKVCQCKIRCFLDFFLLSVKFNFATFCIANCISLSLRRCWTIAFVSTFLSEALPKKAILWKRLFVFWVVWVSSMIVIKSLLFLRRTLCFSCSRVHIPIVPRTFTPIYLHREPIHSTIQERHSHLVDFRFSHMLFQNCVYFLF